MYKTAHTLVLAEVRDSVEEKSFQPYFNTNSSRLVSVFLTKLGYFVFMHYMHSKHALNRLIVETVSKTLVSS